MNPIQVVSLATIIEMLVILSLTILALTIKKEFKAGLPRLGNWTTNMEIQAPWVGTIRDVPAWLPEGCEFELRPPSTMMDNSFAQFWERVENEG